ncbi:ribosome-inactivating family protein [Streptomyces sp. CA-132043]|uniref:ribosome-inactivating family protein n=1 Tax=Streptomyces sp. CA-132043 TaxID=3240048 RepID=UPI003D9133FC
MVRGLFRRSDNYLLGFYVEHGNRQTLYTFTEGGSDMIPREVYQGVTRARFPFPVTYQYLPGVHVSRGRLQDAVRRLFDHDPSTSSWGLRPDVETLAVGLAEGARFQVIPGLIAQHIRGGQDWVVGNHADEIQSWGQRSEVVVEAHGADRSGLGPCGGNATSSPGTATPGVADCAGPGPPDVPDQAIGEALM